MGRFIRALTESELISQDERNLKWRTLDLLEYALLWATGLLLAFFTATVFLDVVLRTIGRPWLWLQEGTLIAFVWAIFVGAAIAVRRNQHFYVTALVTDMTGRSRLVLETVNSFIMLAISLVVAYFGYLNFLQGFGNLLPVTQLPLAYTTGAIPVFGFFTALFTLERFLNGWRNGFEGATHDVREQVRREDELRADREAQG